MKSDLSPLPGLSGSQCFPPARCQWALNKIDLECSFELGEPGKLSRTLLMSLQKLVQVHEDTIKNMAA